MTKIRVGYKETEIGVIPEDWEVKELKEVCSINPESLSAKEDANKQIKYIDIESVSAGKISLPKELKFGDSPSRARRIVKKEDVIVSTVRPYLKAFAPVESEDNNLICSTGFAVLRTNQSIYNYRFLFQTTISDCFINQLMTRMVGSNYPAVNSSDLANTLVTVPPLSEQQRIAEILSTTDAHIEKLDKTIEDYQLLKKGMMKKLLTEGIGHTEFKETEIGRIPKEWEVVTVSKLGTLKKGKGISKNEVKNDGIPCIRYGEIYTSYNHFVRETVSFITEESAKLSELIRYGDIVFAGSGETVEDIGKAVAYLGDKPCYVGGDTIIMQPNEIIDSVFLAYYLASNQVKKQTRILGQGSSIIHIYLEGIKKISIAVPKIDEQRLIGNILEAIDKRIHMFRESKQGFITVKKALMEKLLTGKIRVI
jgi:type I restriction enzyme S subunit